MRSDEKSPHRVFDREAKGVRVHAVDDVSRHIAHYLQSSNKSAATLVASSHSWQRYNEYARSRGLKVLSNSGLNRVRKLLDIHMSCCWNISLKLHRITKRACFCHRWTSGPASKLDNEVVVIGAFVANSEGRWHPATCAHSAEASIKVKHCQQSDIISAQCWPAQLCRLI